MGRELVHPSGVYLGVKADLDLAQFPAHKLVFATDEDKWYKTSRAGLGSRVLVACPPGVVADESVDSEQLADGAVGEDQLAAELGALRDPGRCAINVLRVASDVVSETTVTIGADVYEIEIVNTDSTDVTADSDFDVAEDPIVISAAGYPGTTWAVGILARVENEILRVSDVTGDVVTLARAQSGTTAAAHADAEVIYIGDDVTAGRIAVGLVTTLTPTAFVPALTADINEHATEDVSALAISANELLLHANEPGAVVLACTETLAGANNAWASATMYGGAAPATKKLAAQARVPNATEVALGTMHFMFDAVPTVIAVEVRVTSGGALKAYGGAVAVTDNRVTLTNGTDPDFAATDTVKIVVLLA